jgi:peptidoglycan hydrolase CwlO-like protein
MTDKSRKNLLNLIWNLQESIGSLKNARKQDLDQINHLQQHIKVIDEKISKLEQHIKEINKKLER